jgi:hypoxanthine-guanine phosphoribosyltransferase
MKKPSLGIKPQWIWQMGFELGAVISKEKIEERHKELVATIKRRMDNNDTLLIEWLKEYNEIIKYIEELVK